MVQSEVLRARHRWTPRDLESAIAARQACPRNQVRQAIRALVAEGRLEYSYTFGQSYLVMSFQHPVDIGARFTIIPPTYRGFIPSHRAPLAIQAGAAFGSGRHPTTRLGLRGLEKAWAFSRSPACSKAPVVIDIGTGSGILAIAAARLGAAAVTAVDPDPCARSEAAANIALNPGISSITVTGAAIEDLPGRYDGAMANLRPPTLIQLLPWMQSHLQPAGWMVLSGIRENEWEGLKARYAAAGYHSHWQGCDAGWTGGLFAASPAGTP